MNRKLKSKAGRIAKALIRATDIWASLSEDERGQLCEVVYADPEGLPVLMEVSQLADAFALAAITGRAQK